MSSCDNTLKLAILLNGLHIRNVFCLTAKLLLGTVIIVIISAISIFHFDLRLGENYRWPSQVRFNRWVADDNHVCVGLVNEKV